MDKNQFNAMIGKNVRKQRVAAGFSLEEAARMVGLTVAAVGLMERGERGITSFNLRKLSSAFGISVEAFYNEDWKKESEKTEEAKSRKNKLNKLNAFTSKLSDEELDVVIYLAKSLTELKTPTK